MKDFEEKYDRDKVKSFKVETELEKIKKAISKEKGPILEKPMQKPILSKPFLRFEDWWRSFIIIMIIQFIELLLERLKLKKKKGKFFFSKFGELVSDLGDFILKMFFVVFLFITISVPTILLRGIFAEEELRYFTNIFFIMIGFLNMLKTYFPDLFKKKKQIQNAQILQIEEIQNPRSFIKDVSNYQNLLFPLSKNEPIRKLQIRMKMNLINYDAAFSGWEYLIRTEKEFSGNVTKDQLRNSWVQVEEYSQRISEIRIELEKLLAEELKK